MSRKLFRPALALAALLLAAAPLPAGDPFPASYYGYNLDDPHPGYYGGGRYREYYNYGRGYGLANFPMPLPGDPYLFPFHTYYRRVHPVLPPPDALVAISDSTVVVEVRVPADAEVWFDGAKTQQTGPTRTFVSPPLTPGTDYSYTVRVRWNDAGRAKEEAREVEVHAGDRIRVEFPEPEALPKPRPQPADDKPAL
jgi:uncharacterized protein (TIGR03000 family)